MKRAVLVALLVLAMAVVSTSLLSQTRKDKAVDPVCGLIVDKNEDLSWVYSGSGVKYYFCSKRDLDTFKQSPEKWVRKK